VLAQRVGGAGGENHAHRHLVDDCGEDGGQDQAQPEARGGYGEGVALAFVNARDVRFAVARDRVLAPLRRALLELGPDRLVLAAVGEGVPLELERVLLAAPELDEEDVPHGHGDGEEDAGRVVDEVGELFEQRWVIDRI